MSAEKPEVGDVFLNNFSGERFVVFKKEKTEIYFLFIIDGSPQCLITGISRINEDYTFLGKSKVNINDLFEVK